MNTIDVHLEEQIDLFGRRVAARLSTGTEELPYEIRERMRAAREQALARRRVAVSQPLRERATASGPLGLGQGTLGLWWSRVASALPLIVLAAGLVTIHVLQNDTRARQVAEIDTALLTDDLPPDAYTDPGFVAFLRRER